MNSRLPEPYGRWIDRSKPVSFQFDGRTFEGFAGDTLTTALWANGVRVLGRSFKYHRARGIYSLGESDCNCLVGDGRDTNMRGDRLPIEDGMRVRAVNTIGGAENDWMRFTEWFSPFMPVGFYYKAFHTPTALFPLYEGLLRRAAGLGTINAANPIRHTPKDYDFCDVLVIGAGPSGWAAAVAAAESGADVLLIEQESELGGSLWIGGGDGDESRAKLTASVKSLPNLRVRTGTTAVSIEADNWVALVDETRLTKLRAGSIVFATGCTEQGAVFHYNDLPGVMTSGAALRLTSLYGVKPCESAVVLTANDEGYRACLELAGAGVTIAALVDLRQSPTSEWSGAIQRAGIEIHTGSAVYEALPANGKRAVGAVTIGPVPDSGTPVGPGKRITCDGVVMHVGWSPADNLLRQRGGTMIYNSDLHQFVPHVLPPGVFAVGRANGVHAAQARLDDGAWAGRAAAAFVKGDPLPEAPRPVRETTSQSHPYPIVHHAHGKAFVDFDEDVQIHDIEQSIDEGFDSSELLKRYSTLGMGPSQGKHANVMATRILAHKLGKSLDGLQLTTARPYATPVPMSHLMGRGFTPRRHTALHGWHQHHGAVFMDAGVWYRPEYYALDGQSREECIAGEARTVRAAAGIIDLGTLGKIEIAGPGAVAFLERTYTGRFAKLAVGKCRYAVMCDETGVVIDDGVVARMAEDHFYVTTTTSAAPAVYKEMQRNAIIWKSEVTLANVTQQFCAMSLAGPRYRDILERVVAESLDDAAFPHIGFRTLDVAGVPARVMRLGFVSASGYEIHVPVDSALHVWNALLDAGKPLGLCPFGVEAQRMLRLEMGHIVLGRDTDALSTPYEARLEWALKLDKPDFIGRRSLEIMGRAAPKRVLVGFTLDPGYHGRLPEDCHLVIRDGEITGRVTSIYRSPALGKVIGLAYVAPDQAVDGATFTIRGHGGDLISATVCSLPFYHDDAA